MRMEDGRPTNTNDKGDCGFGTMSQSNFLEKGVLVQNSLSLRKKEIEGEKKGRKKTKRTKKKQLVTWGATSFSHVARFQDAALFFFLFVFSFRKL